MTTVSLQQRIAAFEQAAAKANDPQIMASKISSKSDRKKYDFGRGLCHDLATTRVALCACANEHGGGVCTFGSLFKESGGRIANLNRILQNLKEAREIAFQPECFFECVHDKERIYLNETFWAESYAVTDQNIYRNELSSEAIPELQRKGRSYVAEDLLTRDEHDCVVCSKHVRDEDRITIRAHVFHLSCVECSVCGASPHRKKDYVTFDGNLCCSSECVGRYDGAHVHQKRT